MVVRICTDNDKLELRSESVIVISCSLIQPQPMSAKEWRDLKLDKHLDSKIHDLRTLFDIWQFAIFILGSREIERRPWHWGTRIAQHPRKVKSILHEIRIELQEGKRIQNLGAYAEDLWKRFQ